NEDKAEEVRAFLKRFSALKNKGISIVMIDHCRKPHRTEGYAPKKEQLLGSQDKVANAKTVLMLRSDLHNPVFALYQVKNRLALELKPFMVLMKEDMETGTLEFCYEGEQKDQVQKMDLALSTIPQI